MKVEVFSAENISCKLMRGGGGYTSYPGEWSTDLADIARPSKSVWYTCINGADYAHGDGTTIHGFLWLWIDKNRIQAPNSGEAQLVL